MDHEVLLRVSGARTYKLDQLLRRLTVQPLYPAVFLRIVNYGVWREVVYEDDKQGAYTKGSFALSGFFMRLADLELRLEKTADDLELRFESTARSPHRNHVFVKLSLFICQSARRILLAALLPYFAIGAMCFASHVRIPGLGVRL